MLYALFRLVKFLKSYEPSSLSDEFEFIDKITKALFGKDINWSEGNSQLLTDFNSLFRRRVLQTGFHEAYAE